MLERDLYQFIEEVMSGDAAHDIAHILRVVNSAKQICNFEEGNEAVVIPAAWLHDCYVVPKNHPDRSQGAVLSADRAIQFLKSINYDPELLPQIHHAIMAHSYSAGVIPQTLEAKIVQDADRLDALGAIGLARMFQVGGSFNSDIYHFDDPFCIDRTPDEKKYTIDHIYEKLFKLKALLHTDAAKAEAVKREQFIKQFLKQLSGEIGVDYC